VTEYEAVVYDLDGTLVRLDVDWGAVRARCRGAFRARNVDPEGLSIWEMLGVAQDHGFRRHLESTITDFEREGARSATVLPLAETLPHCVPVGVCSLNAESACRITLELNGIDRHIDTIVGRDTVGSEKPDPEPLLEAVDRLDADPPESLFVGDSESDAETARRAGVDFQWVADRVKSLADVENDTGAGTDTGPGTDTEPRTE